MIRLAGLETEYGCLTEDPAGAAVVIAKVRNWLFANHRFGLVDVHQREWDEPAGNGGFLFNGGRAYVDMGHMEACTPECLDLRDIIKYDAAGDRLLNLALKDLGLASTSGFVRNNIDYYTGATFGCHENYLVRRAAPLDEKRVLSLICFLTLRTLFTGAGRLGRSHAMDPRGTPMPAPSCPFQISQRADYIQNELFEWVQFNRAIVNTRDEPLADARRYRRLHLLHGDTSVLPYTLALKIGTTSLVLDLVEAGCIPDLALLDSVDAMRHISQNPDGPWSVRLDSGEERPATELLRLYQSAAAKEFQGRDAETDFILAEWASTLNSLDSDPSALVGHVDWVTKHWLLKEFMAREGIDWSNPWLRSIDLEFHHIDPERSLALPLAQTPPAIAIEPKEAEASLHAPPTNTRAHVRGMLIRALAHRGRGYFVDWETVDADGAYPLSLLDPFDAREKPARKWLEEIDATSFSSKPRPPRPPD